MEILLVVVQLEMRVIILVLLENTDLVLVDELLILQMNVVIHVTLVQHRHHVVLLMVDSMLVLLLQICVVYERDLL